MATTKKYTRPSAIGLGPKKYTRPSAIGLGPKKYTRPRAVDLGLSSKKPPTQAQETGSWRKPAPSISKQIEGKIRAGAINKGRSRLRFGGK